MAVYYKFKSAKDYDSIPIEGQFISVGNLKERIFESKQLGRGTDFDLMISNAQNNEEYGDEAAMIPKNTSVLIRRVPGRPRKPIVAEPFKPKKIEDKTEELPPLSSMFVGDSSIPMKYPEESEWDEFGNDLYAIPEAVPTQSSNPIVNMSAASMIDEEEKIKALIETPALDWSRQGQDGFGGGRGFERGMGGRMTGRSFGRGGFERKTPPPGYICHRCKVPGHLIQHCPTNGDPNYDVRKVKPPTGIPRSMLMATPDGSYALPSGAVAVLKPNEAAFEKEIEGMPSTRSVGDIPPELRCPLCKEVMKDAVLTSKCCFRSFCDKCIRDYIINKPMCVCGATNILADDLLPNKTLRETITRLLESTTSSTENVPSQVHIQDTESARVPPKIPPPVLSAASKDEHKQIPPIEHSSDVKVGNVKEAAASEGKAINGVMHCLEKKTLKNTEQSEATREPMSTKEPISPEGAQVPEEAQEKLFDGKKKKKKKTRVPASNMQWRGCQDHGAGNFVGMSLGPSAYDPYWGGGLPMGLDGFMPPVGGAMPYIGYMPGPFDVPFGAMMPPDPFAAHGFMMPPLLPRDLSELGFNSMNMNMNKAPPMSREEFEAMKADIRRKRELERQNERDHTRDGSSVGMEVRSRGADRSSMNAKPRMVMSKAHCVSSRYSSPSPPPRPSSKRRSSERNDGRDQEKKEEDSKVKSSVFARISFPESEKDAKKKKKKRMTDASSSSDANVAAANGDAKGHCHHHRSHRSHHDGSAASNGYRRSGGSSEEEEEEDDYHFKRRPSRRQHRVIEEEEEEDGGRYSRASRDHGRRRR